MPQYNKTLIADFGGGQHKFLLRIGEIRELEANCKLGIFAIPRKMAQGEARFDYVRETIRLGLIGGGMAWPEALKLTQRYIDDGSLMACYGLAARILDRTIDPPDELKKKPLPKGKANTTRTSPSATTSSSEPAPL